jgi:uncharacterized protein YndB with AHSA1/START domain
MSEYQQSINIQAGPEQIFRFVSNPQNLPKYLPTVHEAQPQPGARIRVRGIAAGQLYDSDGFFHVDEARRRMEWGSDGENDYRGWLEVKEAADNASSQVTVHLSFEPRPELAERFAQQSGDRDKTVNQGIREALEAIKAHWQNGASRSAGGGR